MKFYFFFVQYQPYPAKSTKNFIPSPDFQAPRLKKGAIQPPSRCPVIVIGRLRYILKHIKLFEIIFLGARHKALGTRCMAAQIEEKRRERRDRRG
jgi:hypothetical protein